jgi:hypothetical protein
MVSVGTAGAAEKAATDQLPAALVAVGAEQSEVVTAEEAQKVRGQWFWMNVDLNVRNYVTDSYVGTDGPASYLRIWIDPVTFHFEAY